MEYVEERDFRKRGSEKGHAEERVFGKRDLEGKCEEREQVKEGWQRGTKRNLLIRTALACLAVVALLVPGRLFFGEVRGFLGTGGMEILSEEEQTSDRLVPGEIPLYLQKDRRWRKERYGSDIMGVTGCGPTCLSMVLCGLRRDEEWMPAKVAREAERAGYYVDGVGSSWSLMTEGAAGFGLEAEQLPLQEGVIRGRLEEGHPIICTMGPGDFTDAGHFIVLGGMDAEGNIQVKDPNSRSNSERVWNLGQLMPQMKNLWAYTYSCHSER